MTNQTTKTRLQDQVDMLARQIEYGFDEIEGSEESPIMDWLEGVLDFQWIVSSDK